MTSLRPVVVLCAAEFCTQAASNRLHFRKNCIRLLLRLIPFLDRRLQFLLHNVEASGQFAAFLFGLEQFALL